MTEKKFTELDAVTTVGSSDVLAVVASSASKKVTKANFLSDYIPTSSGIKLLGTTTITSAVDSVTITSFDSSSYESYLLTIRNLQIANDDNDVYLRFGTSGGIDSGSDYKWAQFYQYGYSTTSNATAQVDDGDDTEIQLSVGGSHTMGTGTGEEMNMNIWITGCHSDSSYTLCKIDGWWVSKHPTWGSSDGIGVYDNNGTTDTDVDRLEVYVGTGVNMDNGIFKFFGVS
tara:strand:- start:2505 stop:3191 length:687 start_codon:yes stop_codon:yes gene_type:complete